MTYPPEIVASLKDLMRWEYFVMVKEILPRRRVHAVMAGKQASKMRGRGLDFEEVRSYSPGDDIRNIDWKVTARTKKTHSKVFVEEKERPSFVILDQSSTMFFGSQKYTKSVIAAQAAALHAFRTIKMGDRFGGVVFNNETMEHVSPKRNRVVIQYFLQKVSVYNNALVKKEQKIGSNSRLNEILFKTKNLITHDFVLSIISDFSDINEETIKFLISLSKHNDLILVHITDPMEQELPNANVLFTDGKFQLHWKYKKTNARKKYQQIMKDTKNKLQDLSRKYGMVYIPLSAALPLEEQIKNTLSKRG